MSNNMEPIRIAVAETSVIIRSGITATLKRLPNLKIQPVEVTTMDSLIDCVQTHCPDILVINPTFGAMFDLTQFKEQTKCYNLKCISLISSFLDHSLLSAYDDSISIYDDLDKIAEKIRALQEIDSTQDNPEEQEALSGREKEIVVCIVKGMTNKEIAESLFLSIHTVITHRRNITRKLQIHSSAGLTIYAIVNKLVDIKDVK